MDHEAYENEMIDTVNRNAEEKNTRAMESPIPAKNSFMNKADANTLKRGLKRTLLAILTAALFVFSIYSFIAVATARGYLAVLLFIIAILALVGSYILLYAQGIISEMVNESKGERK